ncbi:LPXTG cell wall anchor domain-containing protein [Nesterenkonia sp. F]|uniref:LPXTG cell wall anchor domain-containing protein n=1 Tax=Nesterenkonia sp. F TaxID=795955 RepID=UPI000255C823|nr:LPXTG cell wall anchor domain-containing protein [Nesterenkonia sp. F]
MRPRTMLAGLAASALVAGAASPAAAVPLQPAETAAPVLDLSEDEMPLDAPSLQAVVDGDSVTFSWEPVEDAGTYTWWHSVDQEDRESETVDAETTEVTLDDLEPGGGVHTLMVAAQNVDPEGPDGQPHSLSFTVEEAEDGVEIVPTSSDEDRFTWAESSEGSAEDSSEDEELADTGAAGLMVLGLVAVALLVTGGLILRRARRT